MFKVGDVVVCTDKNSYYQDLFLNKQYEVVAVNETLMGECLSLKNSYKYYYAHRFKLDESYYRRKKLEKICSNLGKK